MDFSAAHVSYVITSYAISGVCIIGLFLYVVLRDRALAAKLKKNAEKDKS
jgi:heme exporter protein CcmD